MELSIFDEIDCLKSCFDEKEFTSFISNHSHILKFFMKNGESVTFEVPDSYPAVVPVISVSSSKLKRASKIELENTIRKYAEELIGSLMIMDLVVRLQNLLNDHYDLCEKPAEMSSNEDLYLAVILIDHIRNRNKYFKLLCAWSSELNVCGSLSICHKWIILLLQGTKLQDFIVRYKTVCIDVDSKGKACKEKMSKVLHEEIHQKKRFSTFSLHEFEDLGKLESYFKNMSLEEIYQNVLKPLWQ